MYISSLSPKYSILDKGKYTYITKYSRLHLKKKSYRSAKYSSQICHTDAPAFLSRSDVIEGCELGTGEGESGLILKPFERKYLEAKRPTRVISIRLTH